MNGKSVARNRRRQARRDLRTLQPEDAAFLHDPGAALAMTTPRGARLLLFCIVALLVSAVAWAHRAEVEEVTRGLGKVIPSRQVQMVQNLEGGIVSEITVREGDIVEEGQILLRIDDTRFSSSFREKLVSAEALEARLARLRAEADGEPFRPAPDLLERQPEAVERERVLYESRREELAATLEILDRQVEQRRQELAEMQSRQTNLERVNQLTERELTITRPLVRSGAVSEMDILRLERKNVETVAELDATRLAIPRIESQLLEADRRRDEVLLRFRNQAREEMNRVAAELASMTESNVALEDRVQRTNVRSPVRGTVKKLWVATVGGVVNPGMNLVEIVPLEDTLLIEARIRPSDIAFLHPGQEATVKISAYDFLVYGGLEARLEHISADSIKDTESDAYHYLIRVRTFRNHLGTDDEPLPIIPGMVAEVDILTGKRTILHYLMKPLLRAQQTALRER